MNHQNIELIEGQRMKFILTITNETDLTNYEIEGFTKGFSSCNCSVKEFEVIEVKNNSVTLLTPSLSAGSHGYQLYLTNRNTNQQFKVAEGRIEVTANYSHETHLSEKYATIEATIHSDSIEMNMTIDKGMQGDKGDKGDKGDQGYSAYELAVHHGYDGTEEEWINEFEGAQQAATEAKSSATAAASSEAMSEFYYKGSQTNYNNTITEALNAEQSANNAQSSATEAETYTNNANSAATAAEAAATAAGQYANNANSSATSAQNSALEAKNEKELSKQWAESSKNYFNQTEQIKNETEQLMNQTSGYAQDSLNSYNLTVNSQAAAETAADTAESLVTEANNTIKNAALKSSNNTFSGTNTFNNVTKVTVAPNSLTSVMNEEASILLDFVQQASMRTITSELTQKSGAGTTTELSKNIKYQCPKNNTVSLWQSSLYPFFNANYFNWSAIWVPTYTNINQRTPYFTGCKFRFIPSFSTNLGGATEAGALDDKLLKQVTDITKPFVNYTNVNCSNHCAIVEIFCEIVDKKFKWTIYSPVASSGKVQQVKVITFTTASGSGNYASDTGFLFVNVGDNKTKIFFRNFVSAYYKWQYCGEIFMRNSMYAGSNYATRIYYAGVGGDVDIYMYMPKEIKFLPQWSNNLTNCQQILQSVTATDMTETIITLEEYEALQA